MISRIIKVEASVISRGQRPRLITLAETLITGYLKNLIQLLFYYTLFYGKYTIYNHSKPFTTSAQIFAKNSSSNVTFCSSNASLSSKSLAVSVSEDEGNLAIVRIV